MSNKEHVELIQEGSVAWNAWRQANPNVIPDLSDADLSNADLSGVNLSGANLSGANLSGANLRHANLSVADPIGARFVGARLVGADLSGANLVGADLSGANLSWANLNRAKLGGAKLIGTNLIRTDLMGTDLSWANLSGAILIGAELIGTDLHAADLSGANLGAANIGYCTFGKNDLSAVKGLEAARHSGPSTIGVDTLFKSNGKIPEAFLQGAGVPEGFITQLPSLIMGTEPIQFYSCFISYSHQDDEFSRRLHSRMRTENLRVWYAPEDMQAGRKLHEEIFSAIQVHDKLLLVLSDNSMKSDWVMTEIRRAQKVEREENRRKLFPIRLASFDAIQKWECFDADAGKDLAVELREYYIPDFSNWKEHDAFEEEFVKLLRDLKATER